jgi:hypothetical protein
MEAELVRIQGLDKFYTKPQVAKSCMDTLYSKYSNFELTIEPSAGNGAFVDYIVGDKICIDISPERSDIFKMDYFEVELQNTSKILVVGNPPFGKCSSLAIKFFNHSSKFAEVIAFIVPRTFRRTSVQNRLDLNFKLVSDTELPINPCCFTSKISVKCCFQIWERTSIPRELIKLPVNHPHWEFVKYGPKDSNNQPTPPKDSDFALRAYGHNCGEIYQGDLSILRPKSWHFIKVNCIVSKQEIISNFERIDYSISKDTARQNSLGKAELVFLYENI